MSTFVYQPLAPNQRMIRLVQLQPRNAIQKSSAEPQSSVACTISHVSLDQPPPYSALSYAWGDASQKGSILVNGSRLLVTESLEIALVHLTPEALPLTLWIDALCINQADDVEKTEQVRQMKQIYSQATRVMTWLGPAANDSDVAMRWIQKHGSLAESFGIGTKPDLRFNRLLQTYEIDPRKLPHAGLEDFLKDMSTQLALESRDSVGAALSKLFNRPYWSRVWVVQELVHGKCLQFICGSMTASEEHFHQSLRLFRDFRRYTLIESAQPPQSTDPGLASTEHNIGKPVNIFKVRMAGPCPLIYLIRTFRYFQATDPRDKIFALLGFASDAAALGLYPDYQKCCKDVYLQTTLSLGKAGLLDILSLSYANKSILGLPSWVPDLTRSYGRAALQERAMNRQTVPLSTVLQPSFSASGGGGDSILFEASSRSLLLHGIFIAKIQRTGTIWEPGAFQKWMQEIMEFHCSKADSDDLTPVWRTAVADQQVRRGDQKPRLSDPVLEQVHSFLRGLDLTTADARAFITSGLGDYLFQLQHIARNRRPFCTSKGHLGIGPREMEPGDRLYVFIGAQVPYILRPNTDGSLQLIGEAYAHEIMDGETINDGQLVQAITIC
ncbi:Folylpolyglutamate synthetase [Neonectria magnoliae]|uniref:Folylpolyglutamate synthetase n=1 Tax=Neonectria magnoliae TaxID=2732573 RepID=A0ABR1HMM6_9HYPO